MFLYCVFLKHPTPVLLPGKSHGWRSLVGYSPWGREESDTTERLHFHFSLSCIGEGNGNPLQCSCLENPRDGGAWWAAVYGVAQSRTWLKWLSSKAFKLLFLKEIGIISPSDFFFFSFSFCSNLITFHIYQASLVAQMVKNLPAMRETGFDPWVRKVPWSRKWQPTSVFLPGEFHGQRSLAG